MRRLIGFRTLTAVCATLTAACGAAPATPDPVSTHSGTIGVAAPAEETTNDVQATPGSVVPDGTQPARSEAPTDGLVVAFAGEYRTGGLGDWRELTIDASGEVTFVSGSCDIQKPAVRGVARKVGPVLVLESRSSDGSGTADETASRLVPVAWGELQYLVAEDDMLAFCRAVAEGVEPRAGSFGGPLLRRGDWDVPVTGTPGVPAEFERYLRLVSLRGNVIAVAENGEGTIDIGTADGLREGMELKTSHRRVSALVVEAREHDATIVTRFRNHDIRTRLEWEVWPALDVIAEQGARSEHAFRD